MQVQEAAVAGEKGGGAGASQEVRAPSGGRGCNCIDGGGSTSCIVNELCMRALA